MPVKYLSRNGSTPTTPPWRGTIRSSQAMKGKNAVIQMVISEAPEGEVRYWMRIGDGAVSAGLGDADSADVTIRQSYDTAAKVNSGELDGQKAFTQGKVKISGKMLKMMQLRGPLAEVQQALNTIDTEY